MYSISAFSEQALKTSAEPSLTLKTTVRTARIRKQNQPYQHTDEDQHDLSSLNPSNLHIDNAEMESMLADLSLTSFSSISDESQSISYHCVPSTDEKNPPKNIPQFNVQKQLPRRKDCHFYTNSINM